MLGAPAERQKLAAEESEKLAALRTASPWARFPATGTSASSRRALLPGARRPAQASLQKSLLQGNLCGARRLLKPGRIRAQAGVACPGPC